MIVCGWCGKPTEAKDWETTALTPDAGECRACGHEDPAKPWLQRGQQPPVANQGRGAGGRPSLDISQIRERVRIARKELGADVTNAALAAHLGIDERTLGRWQKAVE
jgi:hypothetical protein